MKKDQFERAKELAELIHQHKEVIKFLTPKDVGRNITKIVPHRSFLTRLKNGFRLRAEQYCPYNTSITYARTIELPTSLNEELIRIIEREKKKYELEFENL